MDCGWFKNIVQAWPLSSTVVGSLSFQPLGSLLGWRGAPASPAGILRIAAGLGIVCAVTGASSSERVLRAGSFVAALAAAWLVHASVMAQAPVPARPSAPAAQQDEWQRYESQTDAAGGAVPAPTVLSPGAVRPIDEEGRRFVQSVEMREAAADAPSFRLALTGFTASVAVGAAVPAVLFAAGAGPCHIASCRDLEMQLWVAGGIALAFAVATEQLLVPLNDTQHYRNELLGDAQALTSQLTLSRPGVHYDDARANQIARAVADLMRLMDRRERYSVETPALLTGVAAGAAVVFATYAILFAATADTARPRTTETEVFAVASGVSIGLSVSSLVWLENTLSARSTLSERIAAKTSELRALVPPAPADP